jgi:hypothetical protein
MKSSAVPNALVMLACSFLFVNTHAAEWKVQPIPIQTRWATEVDPANPLPEYPRPQMVRQSWQNLNGVWGYAITGKDSQAPRSFEGRILVPFPVESALSGVRNSLQPNQLLWYTRDLELKPARPGERTLLHFGAVDFEATAYVNGQVVGRHTGGYQSFTFDITSALKPGTNHLLVRVSDPSAVSWDGSPDPNPHGKQTLKPEGIMYTASSGIWQTVWLERVPATSIRNLRMTPDVDTGQLHLQVNLSGAAGPIEIEAVARSGKTIVASQRSKADTLSLSIRDARLWSPDDPFLYDLQVRLLSDGKKIDEVQSYFGMRKIEVKTDATGFKRIFLNDRYTYNLGILDQGYWPEGLYTAPTDSALKFDVEAIKAMGFNTIRKHAKVEAERWYYHCDRIGVLVWQDMVPPAGPTPQARIQFEAEARENLSQLHNHPSITTWVIFNEGWGAYDQQRIERMMKTLDSSRLINGHSGANFIESEGSKVHGSAGGPVDTALGFAGDLSDMTDSHAYPEPFFRAINTNKAQVLGEYGGLAVRIPGHIWNPAHEGVGYLTVSREEFANRYRAMIAKLKAFEAQGLSGSIYTQPYDVETELNGLMTYDRAVMKAPLDEIKRINGALVPNAGNFLSGADIPVTANPDGRSASRH